MLHYTFITPHLKYFVQFLISHYKVTHNAIIYTVMLLTILKLTSRWVLLTEQGELGVIPFKVNLTLVLGSIFTNNEQMHEQSNLPWCIVKRKSPAS